MKTWNRRSMRLMLAGTITVTALGLAGCNSEGPEEGTDVEDISEGEVASSSPSPEPTAMGGDMATGMATDMATGPGALGYNGLYDTNFYDQADTYAGQQVTVSAEVSETLEENSFVIAGTEDTAVDPLLIIEEEEIEPFEDGQVVQVMGTVQVDFDVVSVEEELGIELDDDLYADYVGEPYLMATSAEVLEDE